MAKKKVKVNKNRNKIVMNYWALIGLVISFFWIFSLIGVGICIVALFQIRKYKQRGLWFAIAGIIIGSLMFIEYSSLFA